LSAAVLEQECPHRAGVLTPTASLGPGGDEGLRDALSGLRQEYFLVDISANFQWRHAKQLHEI
jgi:hypothetical protein